MPRPEPDDRRAPQHRRLPGDLTHQSEEQFRVAPPLIVGDPIDESTDIAVGCDGLIRAVCHVYTSQPDVLPSSVVVR